MTGCHLPNNRCQSAQQPSATPSNDQAAGGGGIVAGGGALAPGRDDDVRRSNLSDDIAELIQGRLSATQSATSAAILHTALAPPVAIDPATTIDRAEYTPYIKAYARKIPRGRFVLNANQPLNWEGDSTEYQATSLAFGHILETRVQWRTNGYSLGRVAHSLTLAPRQTKRIVTVQSRIADRVQRVEETELADSVVTGTDRNYTYQDQIEAHLNEWSSGNSSSKSTGVAGGIGGFLGGGVFGGGAAHGRASSSSSQRGGREVASEENQKLQDSIRTFGDSLRQLDSMVVVDQSQEEFVQGVSEIVRNINYCHSLTIIYHEILRHLRVDTRVVGARESVFIPFELKPFTTARILNWRDTIKRVLKRRDLRWVMKYLSDALSSFVVSSIPDEPRAALPITNISGTIYIQLKIERPRDGDTGEFVEDNWASLLKFTVDPIWGIFSFISTLLEENKDEAFQSKYAPKIATNWANNLAISSGIGKIDGADFTLVNSYRYGNTIRVDFSLSDDTGSLKRTDLTNIRVEVPALPKGSIANVKQIRFR